MLNPLSVQKKLLLPPSHQRKCADPTIPPKKVASPAIPPKKWCLSHYPPKFFNVPQPVNINNPAIPRRKSAHSAIPKIPLSHHFATKNVLIPLENCYILYPVNITDPAKKFCLFFYPAPKNRLFCHPANPSGAPYRDPKIEE